MTKTHALYLDDERTPSVEDRNWIIVRNSDEFKEAILSRPLPCYISFDHDLGEESENGYECLKWFVGWCMDNGVDIRGIEINAHTANPVGRENMLGYLSGVHRFLEQEQELLKPAHENCIGCGSLMHYSVQGTNLFRRPMFQCDTCGFGCNANASIPS